MDPDHDQCDDSKIWPSMTSVLLIVDTRSGSCN